MRMIKTTVWLVMLSTLFSSCGVMFGGSKFSASIIAKDHRDAEIFVEGKKIGKGTAIGLFPRRKPLTVELRQEGCEPLSKTYPVAFRGGNFTLSVLSWGLVGLIVDLSSGAAFKPDHKVDPTIKRMTEKNFVFTVDYSGCPNEVTATN